MQATRCLVFLVVALAFAATVASAQFHGPTWNNEAIAYKSAKLWAAITQDHTSAPWPSLIQEAELFVEQMNLTFDAIEYDDMMPNELKIFPYKTGYTRTKLIHAQGVVSAVQWVSTGKHNYTGLFTGATGFARMSLAGKPTFGGSGTSMTPGIAIKFLRNKLPSAHIIAMFQLGGQSNANFFEHDLTNHVPDLGTDASVALQIVRSTFAAASNWPTMLGLSDFANADENGPVAKPSFPFRLVFHPTTKFHNMYNNSNPSDSVALWQELCPPSSKDIPAGPMYEVWAQDSPNSNPMDLVHIANVVVSACTQSGFGDQSMYMRHTRMENDFAYRPDWVEGAQAIINQQQSVGQYYFPDLPWN